MSNETCPKCAAPEGAPLPSGSTYFTCGSARLPGEDFTQGLRCKPLEEAYERGKRDSNSGLLNILARQIIWSMETFGPDTHVKSITEHIKKELDEIEADPKDLKEWVDVIILGFDGAWRAGHTPEEIEVAIVAKQTKNEGRKWPDWRTHPPGVPFEHIREDWEEKKDE
jgi:hypothetical protein